MDGIRCGELMALMPSDFLLETSELRIDKSCQRLRGEDVVTKPKTRKSVRTIKMPAFLRDEMAEFIEMREDVAPDERLFGFTKHFLVHEMNRGCKASGVKRIRIHDLRHSHVSLLIKDGQRDWCTRYLGFPSTPVVDDIDRSREQSRDHIERTMNALMREDNFTASDFCQLRNAVLHTGSSVVDGAGAKYSPFHSIGIQVFDNDSQLVIGYGSTSSPEPDGVENDCRIKITLNLTALLARMEKGVARFLSEYPELDREKGKWDCLTWGIVDYRAPTR